MVEKHFNNKIAPVRSRGGSLVRNIHSHVHTLFLKRQNTFINVFCRAAIKVYVSSTSIALNKAAQGYVGLLGAKATH
jgi:hypothetical protein